VRVTGDIMITNVEMDRRHFLRKGEKLPALRAELGDGATDAALAARLGVEPSDIAVLDEARQRGYHGGGFRVWNVADKASPELLAYVKTHGFGVHRFDADARYAYISTEMEGYVGNILVTYDMADPSAPPKSRAGTCRASMWRGVRRLSGPATGAACTTPCAAATSFGRRSGMPGCACSMRATWRRRR
jgi:hypothetical protein